MEKSSCHHESVRELTARFEGFKKWTEDMMKEKFASMQTAIDKTEKAQAGYNVEHNRLIERNDRQAAFMVSREIFDTTIQSFHVELERVEKAQNISGGQRMGTAQTITMVIAILLLVVEAVRLFTGKG